MERKKKPDSVASASESGFFFEKKYTPSKRGGVGNEFSSARERSQPERQQQLPLPREPEPRSRHSSS